MKLFAFETRWTAAALEAFAPPGGPGLSPEPGEVDYLRVHLKLLEASNHGARAVLRLAGVLAGLSPLWLAGRPTTLDRLPAAERADLMGRFLGVRFAPAAELAALLKLSASNAFLGTPSVRRRSGYDLR